MINKKNRLIVQSYMICSFFCQPLKDPDRTVELLLHMKYQRSLLIALLLSSLLLCSTKHLELRSFAYMSSYNLHCRYLFANI
jgi:hypothetical protein